MIKGNLSRTPAPYVYIDGESLFEKTWFGTTPKLKYVDKLVQLLREVNTTIVIFPTGRVSKYTIERSPFVYTDIMRITEKRFTKFLYRKKKIVLIALERVSIYQGIGRYIMLDNIAEDIFREIGV